MSFKLVSTTRGLDSPAAIAYGFTEKLVGIPSTRHVFQRLLIVGALETNLEQLQGLPVLFIPGNAGSSRQVRSIASSASRQYYSFPSQASPDFKSRGLKPLDFFAGEHSA